ncbi:hypothetical protein ABW20_dc0103927 [Dactylellina cionopaga]|nr:hypothetical protein ABW20_dc0103927 [Dactylellina cionopaga]
MAEAVFHHVAKENNLLDKFDVIDSAGTIGYHAGGPPDSRSVEVCVKNGVKVSHIARQVRPQDFKDFDYILAMDDANVRDLEGIKPSGATRAQLMMFGDFEDGDRKGVVVEDPYYGGKSGFTTNFKQCQRYSVNFMNRVLGANI